MLSINLDRAGYKLTGKMLRLSQPQKSLRAVFVPWWSG